MKIRWLDDWTGVRKSTTRIPFRYGAACLVDCPQLLVGVTVEVDGQRSTGWSGDCLPPGWFDKAPGLSYPTQLRDMQQTILAARDDYREALGDPAEFFPVWLDLQRAIPQAGAERGVVPLLASFGLSLWERAILDAACRAYAVPFAEAVRRNLFQVNAGAAHSQLQEAVPADWLPPAALECIAVRHTVGMGDPLRDADIAAEDRLADGRPQSLEAYLRDGGIWYLKIKVGADERADVERLCAIAETVEAQRGGDYHVTLDGNEQFTSWSQFAHWLAAVQRTRRLGNLWHQTLAIEQPLSRSVALDEPLRDVQAQLGGKPVIIDESDGELDAYQRAVALGYGGVSSKNCKGALRSILNAGLVDYFNREQPGRPQLMTGEDLCSVGVIPVQADLCLAATLGLTHVERNGHHFHPGLAYLPADAQRDALRAHPDFYTSVDGIVSPRLDNGEFHIGSLQCIGFGFDWRPRHEDWTRLEECDWSDYAA